MFKYSTLSLFATAVRSLLALILLAGGGAAAAQAPGWQSARAVAMATAAAANTYSGVMSTAVDAAGNVYLAGSFTNSVMLGGTTLTSLGGPDVFVAKFNPATNQFVWAQRAGGTGDDLITKLAVSGTNIYVAGHFQSSTAGFGTTILTNAGANDVFVAKLNDAGSFIWAQGTASGTGDDKAYALTVSGASVYVGGHFQSPTVGFGTTILTNAGANDMFVAKLSDAGNTGSFVWAQRAGGTNVDQTTALAVSGTSVYVGGYFQSPTATFGTIALTNAGANSGFEDVFVAKLNDAGNTGSFVWAQRAGGSGADAPTALAVSGTSVYVSGFFGSSTAGFGPIILTSAGTGFRSDVFVAKLVDAGSTGSFIWAQQAGGTGFEVGNALAVIGTNVYVAGYFDSATADFGTTTLTNAGSNDVFVAKLNDAGNTGSFVWAQRAGGMGGT